MDDNCGARLTNGGAGARIDPSVCPLCGKENGCAMAAGRAPESCWCFAASLSADALGRIPPEAKGQSCLCRECAGGSAR
ncbi:cysteine-rich CWC family protein [Cohnella fermenti]|uniref:Cysteine-rich CWC family protein n=1 Tax=Cohnella fermenti TaxID=2565925 RepID=A0A4S4BR36_9BACL|nr:cysteine-rich CWC family protein [Cohnella fermenti]THF77280.1 hypothetical protein E6C55_16565 [Cohnella fermenti]